MDVAQPDHVSGTGFLSQDPSQPTPKKRPLAHIKWTTHPAVAAVRDNADYIRVLLKLISPPALRYAASSNTHHNLILAADGGELTISTRMMRMIMMMVLIRMMIMMMMAHGVRNPGWGLCSLDPVKEMKRTVVFEFALEGAVALTISAVSKIMSGRFR